MTTREKIIVGIMCLAIFYGAYELLFARQTPKTIPPPVGDAIGELKLFAAEVGQKLNNERVVDEHRYMIDQAGAAWDKDPFIHSTKPLQKRPALENADRRPNAIADRPNFVCTGFLQLGTTVMAIINGMEYMTGDALADKTFYVKSISPQRVVIGKVNSQDTIQLPISESDAGSGQ